MAKIKLELDEKYWEYIQLVKELILTDDWKEITDDNQAVEVLLESFVWFLQEQAAHEHEHVHWPDCNHDHN